MGIKDVIKKNEEKDRMGLNHGDVFEEMRSSIKKLKWTPYESEFGTGFKSKYKKLELDVFPYISDVQSSMPTEHTLNSKISGYLSGRDIIYKNVYGFKILGRLSGRDIIYNSTDENIKGYNTILGVKKGVSARLERIIGLNYLRIWAKSAKRYENELIRKSSREFKKIQSENKGRW